MIFGDGAAAIVVGLAPEGSPPDIEFMQTYASGPISFNYERVGNTSSASIPLAVHDAVRDEVITKTRAQAGAVMIFRDPERALPIGTLAVDRYRAA